MKQIKETEKITTIILEDGDIINLCKMGHLKQIVRVISSSHTLYFDDITYKELMNIKEEKRAIHQIDSYLKKNDI